MATKRGNKSKRGPEALIDMAFVLSRQKEIDDVFQLVGVRASGLLDADAMLILMFNPRTHNTLKTILKRGEATDDPKYRHVQNQVSGWILKNDSLLVSADICTDERFHKMCFDDAARFSVLGAPMRYEQEIIGTLIAFRTSNDNPFAEADAPFLEKIALIAAPYLNNVEKLAPYFKKPLPKSKLISKYSQNGLVGTGAKFIDLLQTMDAATRCDVRVLLEGQSGTGKELIARAIHDHSPRSAGPFVAVDCGAIPTSLMESELFGHVKGAFTGATRDRKGLFEEADHGTLFMDEIINLPIEMQAKLMRVLQESEIRPVGANKPRKVDVRVFAAASKSLQSAVKAGDFREDLYYRLFVYPIVIPTLQERREDIPLLADFFLQKFAKEQNKKLKGIDDDLQQFLLIRPWPGNIRELENFMERVVTLAPEGQRHLDAGVLPAKLAKEFEKNRAAQPSGPDRSLVESLAEVEAQLIREALSRSDWNQSRAARSLKISVQALRYKMTKLGIRMPEQK